MCEYCHSYWTTCQDCGKSLCKSCTTRVSNGMDMCPACADKYEEKEDGM